MPKGLKAFGFTTISKEQKELTVLLEATKYKDYKANKAAEKIRQVVQRSITIRRVYDHAVYT